MSIPFSSRSPLYQKAWHTQRHRALGQEPMGENLLTLRTAIAKGGDAMEAIADWSKVVFLLSSSGEAEFESGFAAVISRGIEPSFLMEEALLTGHDRLLLWLINKLPVQGLDKTPASTYGIPLESARYPRHPDYRPPNLMTLFLACQSRPVIEAVLGRGLLDPAAPQPYAIPGAPLPDSVWKGRDWTPLALSAMIENRVLFDALLAHPAVRADARSKDEALMVISASHGKTPYRDPEREICFEWKAEDAFARLRSLVALGANPETPFERTIQHRQAAGLVKTSVVQERAAVFWIRSTLSCRGPAIGDAASLGLWNAFFIRQASTLHPESWKNSVTIMDHHVLRALQGRRPCSSMDEAFALAVRGEARFRQGAGLLVGLCSEANSAWMLDWWAKNQPPIALETLGAAVFPRARESVLGANGRSVTPVLACRGLPLECFGMVLSDEDRPVWQETVRILEEAVVRYVAEKGSPDFQTREAAAQAMSMAFALPHAPTSRPKVRL